MPKEGAVITQYDVDIGEVADKDNCEVDTTIHATEVASVITLESYAACIACKKNLLTSWGAAPNATQCNAYQNT